MLAGQSELLWRSLVLGTHVVSQLPLARNRENMHPVFFVSPLRGHASLARKFSFRLAASVYVYGPGASSEIGFRRRHRPQTTLARLRSKRREESVFVLMPLGMRQQPVQRRSFPHAVMLSPLRTSGTLHSQRVDWRSDTAATQQRLGRFIM